MNLQDLATHVGILRDELVNWDGVIQIGYKLSGDAIIAASIFGKVLLSRQSPFVLFQCDNIMEEIQDRSGNNYIFIGHHPKEADNIPKDISYMLISEPVEYKKTDQIINASIYDANIPEITLSSIAFLMCENLVSHIPETRNYITILPLVAQQTIEMKSKPKGLQESIYEQAKENDLIEEYSTIGVLGSDIYSINDALLYSQDPFLPNLTDNEGKVIELLNKAGIVVETSEGYRKFSDLETEELKKLNSAIVSYLQSNSGLKIKQLNFIAKKIVLKHEYEESILHNIWDFSRAVMDAINRKQPSLALGVILGNRGQKLRELKKMYKEERQSYVTSFDFLIDKREDIINLSHLNYLQTDKKFSWYNAILIAGMVIASGMSSNKQPFAIIIPGPKTKITIGVRASSDIQLNKGLSEMLGEICNEHQVDGSIIGSHYEARCSIPAEKWEDIIVDLNTKLGSENA